MGRREDASQAVRGRCVLEFRLYKRRSLAQCLPSVCCTVLDTRPSWYKGTNATPSISIASYHRTIYNQCLIVHAQVSSLHAVLATPLVTCIYYVASTSQSGSASSSSGSSSGRLPASLSSLLNELTGGRSSSVGTTLTSGLTVSVSGILFAAFSS